MKLLIPSRSEGDIQARIRLAVGSLPDVRLFRNNQGMAWVGDVVEAVDDMVLLRNARRTRFVLADGASDLIGLRRVVITEAMVGQVIGQFAAVEVKRPGKNAEPVQQCWLDFVEDFGGLAGVVRSEEDALRLVCG